MMKSQIAGTRRHTPASSRALCIAEMDWLRFPVAATALLLSACGGLVASPSDGLLPGQRFPIAVEPQMLSWRVSLDGETLNPVAERQMEQIAADYSENGNGAITIASTARD